MEYPAIFNGCYLTLRGRVLLSIVDFQFCTVNNENGMILGTYNVSTNRLEGCSCFCSRDMSISSFYAIASTVNSTLYLPCCNTKTLGFWCIAADVPHLKSTHSSFRSCITSLFSHPYVGMPVLRNNVQCHVV